MLVLVAYGSKMGGTKGLAQMVGTELEANGFRVDVMPARSVSDLAAYGAVVLGGALYSLRWHKDARRFIRKHRVALQTKPVWLFEQRTARRFSKQAGDPTGSIRQERHAPRPRQGAPDLRRADAGRGQRVSGRFHGQEERRRLA